MTRAFEQVPAETQTGKLFRMRGKGVKSVRSHSHGDLFCRVVVETPVNLTAEQRELVKQLDESLQKGGTRHTPREKSFFEGVKSFFTGDA